MDNDYGRVRVVIGKIGRFRSLSYVWFTARCANTRAANVPHVRFVELAAYIMTSSGAGRGMGTCSLFAYVLIKMQ